MVKIGSLEVRTIGKGKDRVKVVKFPGHEFGIEHFLPANLEYGRLLSTRALQVKSNHKNPTEFILKRVRHYPDRLSGILTNFSEARLARYLNQLNLHSNTTFEQPLAAIVKPNGSYSTVYRKVDHDMFIPIPIALEEKLRKLGIEVVDRQAMRDRLGKIHVFDLEYWQVEPELKKKLKLKTFGD